MKKNLFPILLICLTTTQLAFSQSNKYFSKNAIISFDAEGKLDDIEEIKATTKQAICIYDDASRNFEWSVSIKSFVFANSLMQEHFNENYLESSKYPKATFIGKIDPSNTLTFDKDGTYPVKVTGKLTMHGITQNVSTSGMFNIQKGIISASAKFEVTLADYKIDIPTLVFMKVAEIVKINVSTNLQPLKHP